MLLVASAVCVWVVVLLVGMKGGVIIIGGMWEVCGGGGRTVGLGV